MRLHFLTLPPEECRLYIEQAAIRRNVSPVLLEMDFWVCWLLGLLFGSGFAERVRLSHGSTAGRPGFCATGTVLPSGPAVTSRERV